MGIALVPPCVNRSEATFTVAGALVYALGALKNVGVDAMRLIVGARGEALCDAVRSRAAGGSETGGQAAAGDAGARRGLRRAGPNRRAGVRKAGCAGGLFGGGARGAGVVAGVAFGEAGADLPEPRLPSRDDWLPVERLAQEHQAVGFYLSGHPLDDYMGPAPQGGDDAGRGHAQGRAGRWWPRWRVGGRAAGAEIGARQPLCLCATVGPDGALRGDGVLRHAGSRAQTPAGAGP
jgi:DNA polymerase III alpha subunit